MDFAEKVRFVRERLKISQENLARELNVSYATVNRWENSKTTPNNMARIVFNDFCKRQGVFLDDNGQSDGCSKDS
ncbi:MAG: helix-turn-helix domain-containing protein [Oscillospiraceae bacterium]|nr:helix-turn-helix domain-containing protein [Oscillospiraceae bacterium]